VLAIVRRDKPVFFESLGYLDKAAGTAMRPDAIFALVLIVFDQPANVHRYDNGVGKPPVLRYKPRRKPLLQSY